MKQIRNAVNCGIVVPQYVSLHVYDYGFYTRVTFPISENMVAALRRVAAVKDIYNGHMDVVEGHRGGKHRWYVCIHRNYQDLNLIHHACYRVAAEDVKFLKVEMRQAKIHALTNEINNIQNNY